jgi:diguanylate cyclase (GGDEF)-like protein
MSKGTIFSRAECLMLALGAIAFVMLAAALAVSWEIDDSRRLFDLESQSISSQVSRRLAEGETLIDALHGFNDSADEEYDARLPAIVERFVRDHPQVQWMARAEQVGHGDGLAFERRLRGEGFMGLRIRSFDDSGDAIESDLRLPIDRLEPLTPTRARFLGADVASRAGWRGAIEHAVSSGAIAAVATHAPALDLDGVLLLRAIYRGNVEPDNKVDRRQQLAGMLLLFLDTDALVADLVTALPDVEISLITQNHATPKKMAFHGDALNQHHSVVLPESVADIDLPLQISAPLDLTLRGVVVSTLVSLLVVFSALQTLRGRRVTQREESRAFVQAQLAEITLHSIGEAVIRLDEGGRVRYLNPVAEAMSGFENGAARERALEDVLDLSVNSPITAASLSQLTEGRADVQLKSASDSDRALACTVSPINDAEGLLVGRVLVMRDVSREHELTEELAYQASHDPLTELPNRRRFEHQLMRAVEQAQHNDIVHALLYIDLDQFKLVNDTCGHVAGDQMLRQIAGLLQKEVRDRDLLARLGGDEFGVLLDGCSIDEAMVIADRICRTVSAFRFVSDGRTFELGASIGLVEIGRNSGTADEVQRTADLACYAAKDTGRNRVHLYRHEDLIISRNQAEMQWHSEIKAALEDERLVLYAQPIARLHHCKGPMRMHEMLLRMVDREGSMVPPMAFLPAAERYGLMGEVDRAVIEMALAHVALADTAQDVFTINLSGHSFTDPGIGSFITAAAHRVGVDPRQICFEVTETAAISNLAQAERLMQSLHGQGFRFALDDFGAGLSSFAYLKQLPVDFIKIDGQFVRDINNDAVARAMVSSIVNVANVMNIETVAEKVEHEAVQACLRSLGVDYVQGFYVGRPQPLRTPSSVAARSNMRLVAAGSRPLGPLAVEGDDVGVRAMPHPQQ